MLDWPEPAPSAEVPFMMMLLRGKAYLRMEYTPADLAHAAARGADLHQRLRMRARARLTEPTLPLTRRA